MIVHASLDENGNIKGGAAGDQTGKEVCVRTFYSKPWNVMLRYKDSSIAEKATEIGIKLANSNLVGYDQNQRNTLYTQLKKHNFDVDAYIKSGIKTETDCSAFQYAIYCCLIPAMRQNGNAPTTSTMRNFYLKHGFTAYTDSKYLTSDSYLMKGDLLLKEGKHVAQNTTTGAKAKVETNNISISKFSPTKGNNADFVKIIKNIKSALNADYKLSFNVNDGNIDNILLTNLSNVVLTKTSYKSNITYALQQLLCWWGYVISMNGSYGSSTETIVKTFQKQVSIPVTGTTTLDFWKKILGK